MNIYTALSIAFRSHLIVVLMLLSALPAGAQCDNWRAATQIISSSNCAANGSFKVVLSGPDSANLTNVQYGIPISSSGFAVPLNNASTFSNIPSGTYTVSVVASCGGNPVGKNTTVTIAGGYIDPIMVVRVLRGSVDCPGAKGRIEVNMYNGQAPYTLRLTNFPAGYNGPQTFTSTAAGLFPVSDLVSGNYTVQMIDACGNGVAPQTINVHRPLMSDLYFREGDFFRQTCDSITISRPTIAYNSSWAGYESDTVLKISMQIPGLMAAATPFTPINAAAWGLKLPAGKTLKDCYGKTLTYTVKNHCDNQQTTGSYIIPVPYARPTVSQNCNTDFNAAFEISGMICFPVTYAVTNLGTGSVIGPFTSNVPTINLSNLPIGSYNYTITTADNFVMNGTVGTSLLTLNPYSVQVQSGANNYQNYIESFIFTAYPAPRNARVDLFSGPLGYSSSGTWTGVNNYVVRSNGVNILPNTMFFKAGTYVWRITDDCGIYFLPVTVTAADLYQFTAGVSRTRQTCDGLWIWPTGTATNNGRAKPVRFMIYSPTDPLQSVSWLLPGDSLLIRFPGHYVILPTADSDPQFYGPPYNISYEFDYTVQPTKVDINSTQGFLCIGAGNGQAQLFVKGSGGIPFKSPIHYKYSLAQTGNGASGPYIQTNITGQFTGFGGRANDLYDVKTEDSCGAFAVQQVKILDLANMKTITSSKYVACEGDNVQLSVAYLPNATYSWSGPAGFTSNIRDPLLSNVRLANAGKYFVTITTPVCSGVIKDSTVLSMLAMPPKPTAVTSCDSEMGTVLTLINTIPSLSYQWAYGRVLMFQGGVYRQTFYPAPPPYTRNANGPGSWTGVAIDTATGCRSFSDSVYFGGYPGPYFEASLFSPRNKVCTGDTVLLYAMGNGAPASYKWYRNGVLLPGVTSQTYQTTVPGNYKVWIDAGFCQVDTSDEVVVAIIPIPTASISASGRFGCLGDTIRLSTGVGAGYIYSWQRDGVSVPGAGAAVLNALESGTYQVTVANEGCARTSDTLSIVFSTPPVISLNPAVDQKICAGEVVHFTIASGSNQQYIWYRDGAIISNVSGSSYDASLPGKYMVSVAAGACPNVVAGPVEVTVTPSGIDLGKDTVVCDPSAFSITLSVTGGYDHVLWSGGQTSSSITVTTSGVYWAQATNRCGTFRDTVIVRALSDYIPKLPEAVEICNEYNIGGFSVPALLKNIKWSTGATTAAIPITVAGTYWVEGESPCGMLYDTMKVTFCAPEISGINLPKDTICEGDCIKLSAVVGHYPQQYEWILPGGNPSTSNAKEPYPVCYDKAGIYPVTLRVSNAGGADSMTTQLVVAVRPVPRFTDTTVVVGYKKNIVLPACAEAAVVAWYKDDSLVCGNCKSISVTGLQYQSVYHCVVSNGGCVDSCVYKMQVIDIPHDIWLPDAFTPNGDGRNDVFRVITDNPNVYGVDLSVYNRYGQKVHTSHSGYDGWDGHVNGTEADAGTYFWLLNYRVLGTDEHFSKKGDVILIK